MDLFKRLDFNTKGAETVQVRTAVGGIGACVAPDCTVQNHTTHTTLTALPTPLPG